MLSPDDALALYLERKRVLAPMHDAMASILAVYKNEVEIPLPDMGRNEKSSVPNLLAQGVDQMAGRVASVVPSVRFPVAQPGVRKYERRADTASEVMRAWWEADRLPLKMKRRARHLIALSMAPTMVRYDARLKRPTWEVRKPLESYPAPQFIDGTTLPTDMIFSYRRTVKWLRQHGYEPQVRYLVGPGQQIRDDSEMVVVEYVDPSGTMMILSGWTGEWDPALPWSMAPTTHQKAVLLEFSPTPGDIMAASAPSRITLDDPAGQFDNMVGMFYTQAKLMALEVIGVEKGIFPDTYLVGRPNETPRFVEGPYDGRTGQVNVVTGGDVKEVQSAPGYMTQQTVDRLERNSRITAGIPSEFGGESGTNIRTGRRGDAVLSSVIDYPVAESQELFAYALHDENMVAIRLAKEYDGSAPRHIYMTAGTNPRKITYVSSEVFEDEEHSVAYPVTGADMNSLLIGIGQRIGLGYMSKESGALYDPFIEDPEVERDRVVAEGLEQALVAGLQQQAASGAIPPVLVAKIADLVRYDKMELGAALTKVVEDAAKAQQEQQAAASPAPSAEQMAAPGAASLTGSPIPGSNPGQDAFAQLLARLRQPTMTIQPMRGVGAGAV